MNPYDFVRLPDHVTRESVLMHDKFRGHNGAVRCRLTAITPIFIPKAQTTAGAQEFITARYDGRDLPFIPGSSLKGMIRSVAEALSPSCIGLSRELFDRGEITRDYQGKINRDFRTCTRTNRLCPACRLFGMVSRDGHFLGKVSLSDARTQVDRFRSGPQIILKPLMEPKPRHSAFYLPEGKVAGRKFYFHHSGPPRTTSQATSFTRTITPLEGLDAQGSPQTVFEFDLQFSNLTDYEYSLMIFALTLTDQMRHKIGGGKPHGLGTVKIEAINLSEHDPAQRYSGLAARQADTPIGAVRTGDELQAYLQTRNGLFTTNPSPSLTDLQRIWQFPPATDADGNPIDYQYPDQSWFSENSETPISGTP